MVGSAITILDAIFICSGSGVETKRPDHYWTPGFHHELLTKLYRHVRQRDQARTHQDFPDGLSGMATAVR